MGVSNIKQGAGNRLLGLDILRGLAALTVVLFHYTAKFPEFFASAKSTALQFSTGFYGVHMFFMVSGFVILMSLSRPDGKQNGDGFIRSRFIRLYPVFWVSVLLTSAVLAFSDIIPSRLSMPMIAANLTMLQGYVKIAAVDGVYWSLTYELGFYVFIYMLFRFGFAKYVEALPLYMTAGAVFFHYFSNIVPHPLQHLLMINSYGHLFAGGMAFFLIQRHGLNQLRLAPVLAIPLVQLLYDGPAGFWAGCIIIALMGWSVSAFDPFKLKANQSLAIRYMIGLGAISYALYLTHQMMGYVVLAKLQTWGVEPNIAVLTTLVGAVLLAMLLTYGVEKPAVIYLKRHLPKSFGFSAKTVTADTR